MNSESWMELCEQATKETDPNKLLALTKEIVRLLDEKKRKPLYAGELNLPGNSQGEQTQTSE